MKLKKLLLMGLSLVTVAAISVGGTLAFLQNTDSDVNVMTTGNVYIEQHEYQRAEGVLHNAGEAGKGNGIKKGDLVPFVQGQPLYPAVPSDEEAYTAIQEAEDGFYWGDYVYSGTAWNGLWDDSKLANVMDKMVFVENTGKTDAYVRTIIAYECPDGMTVGDAGAGDNIGVNYNTLWNEEEIGKITVGGVEYAVYSYTYTVNGGVLAAGDTAHPSLLQVVMNHEMGNEDVAKFGDTYDILVLSQAIQTAGFHSAAIALDTGFGTVNAENAAEWFKGEAFGIPVTVSSADELVEALESDKDVVLTKSVKIDPAKMSNAYGKTGINVKNGQTIDGNGYTIDIKGAGGTWDSGINTTGGKIKNLTVTGSFRGIFINHNSTHSEPVILDNVVIDGTTYTISCDQGMNQTLTATNSTFNGWTSFAETLGEATFIDCNFGEGNGYAYCRPYAPTTFKNCNFEAGYEMDSRAAIVLENCYLDGVLITESNLSTLVTSNIQNAVVK